MFRFQNTGVLKLNSNRLYSTLRFFPAVSLYSQKGHLPNFQSFNF